MKKYIVTGLILVAGAVVLTLTSCDFPIKTAEAKEVIEQTETDDQRKERECYELTRKYIEWERIRKRDPQAKPHMEILYLQGRKQCKDWHDVLRYGRKTLDGQIVNKLQY